MPGPLVIRQVDLANMDPFSECAGCERVGADVYFKIIVFDEACREDRIVLVDSNSPRETIL